MKNFNSIRDSVNLAVLHIMKEDRARAKKILKEYRTILKNSPELKETLYIHENFEKGSFKNEEIAHGFIIENLMKIRNLNKSNLKNDLRQLEGFMVKNRLPILEFKGTVGDKVSNLIMNLDKTNKSLENNKIIEGLIETVINRQNVLSEDRKDPVNQKIYKKVLSEKYNNKYSTLSEQEKKIVKAFVSGNEKTIKEEYTKVAQNVINQIKESIDNTEDYSLKLKYYQVQTKLYESLSDDTITIPHFQKLFDLEKTMK